MALSDSDLSFWRTFLCALAPKAAGMDASGWQAFFGILETAIAERPLLLRAGVRAYIVLLRLAAFPLGGFCSMPPGRRARLLTFFQDFPLALIRAGFWGLRALALMGYYGQPSVAKRLGWAPIVDGNKVLHA